MAGRRQHLIRATCATSVAALLAACGGGGGGDPSAAAATAAASAATSAASAISQSESAVPASDAGAPAAPVQSFEDRILSIANAWRAAGRTCGTTAYPPVGPLRWQAQTEQAARAQAQHLQQNNLFTHAGAGGSTVGDRLTATGYAWASVGENIAAGQIGIDAVMRAWIESPGHCANLMNAGFTELGVALVPGTSSNTYRTYWGMVLARPR